MSFDRTGVSTLAVTPAFTSESFTMSLLPDRARVVIALGGELDTASVDDLDRQARELRRAGFDQLVVDLRDLRFLDSSGLRVLLSLRNDARREGHRLTLVAGPRAVQRIFEVTGTAHLFDWASEVAARRLPHVWDRPASPVTGPPSRDATTGRSASGHGA